MPIAEVREVKLKRKGCGPINLTNAHARRFVVVQQLVGFRQRRVIWTDGRAIWPIRRTDGDVARIAAKTAAELRIADDDKRARFRRLIEIGHAFGLSKAVMHQPGLTFEIGGGVRIERLMAVKKDVALPMQELECIETDAGELLQGGEFWMGPRLRSV